jgi:ligand-binding SRPBCC domain-containing protein
VKRFCLQREQLVRRPIGHAFAFFASPANLNAITPAWLQFKILAAPPHLYTKARIQYRLRWRGLPLRWTAEISVWNPPHQFVDTQVRGPYRLWRHTHQFRPFGSGTVVSDFVEYALPFGNCGTLLHALLIKRDLEAIFDFRARQLKALLDLSP